MATGNQTVLRSSRFLDEDHFGQLYAAFTQAFSDYVFPFALTETQFRNHLVLTGVDLNRTVACFEGERMIGFSMNGFGSWRGRSTVYDAGTGVVPDRRRLGVSEAMFEIMVPRFREEGIETFLLEVIDRNHAAIRLYEKLGFEISRELALLQCDKRLVPTDSGGVEVRDIIHPDWNELCEFWSAHPSWQNSIEAIDRSIVRKVIKGAFVEGKCVGYIVYSQNFGRVAQFAVAQGERGHGVGRALVEAMQADTDEGYSLQVINIDKSIASAMDFFRSLGFYERFAQYEMILDL